MAKKPTPEQRTKRGRPAGCTPEVTKRVCDAIRKGAGREDAANAAGVGRSTLLRWLAEGAKRESGVYRDFLDAVEGAERDLVNRAARVVVDLLGPKQPPAVRFAAAKLVLQSRRPALWRPKQDVQLSGPDGKPVEVAAEVKGELEHSGQVGTTPLVSPELLASLTPEQFEAFGRGLGLRVDKGDNDNDEGR